MAKKSKAKKKETGITLIVVGIGLAFWGYQKSGGFRSQFSSAFSGSPSDSVMLLYIVGAACLAAGIFLFTKK